jgi:hypothetical protein
LSAGTGGCTGRRRLPHRSSRSERTVDRQKQEAVGESTGRGYSGAWHTASML